MKRIIMVAILMITISSVLGATSRGSNINYKRGYIANIDVGGTFIDRLGFRPEIITSHGYSFGNGIYFGGGIGLGIETWEIRNETDRVFIPLFADFKYSFIDRLISPYVNVKAGAMLDCIGLGIGYMLLPSIGVDIWRFSLSIGYQNYSCAYNVPLYEVQGNGPLDMTSTIIGISEGRFGGAGLKIGLTYSF